MPNASDSIFLESSMKDEKSEKNCINDLVQAVKGFYIKSSRFSQKHNSDTIICRLKENLEYDEEFYDN